MKTQAQAVQTPPQSRHWQHQAVAELARVQASPNSGEHGYGATPLRGHLGGQDGLGDKSLIYMGLGAVGAPGFLDAARLGVGTLLGVDLDRFGEDSWRTQLATPEDTGAAKAEILGALAHRINPAIAIRTTVGHAQDLPLRELQRADAFVVAGDNLELLVWAGTMAAALKKPLFQGAVHGETWTAFVRGYDLRDPSSPCPACQLNPREWRQLSSRYGCDPATMRAQGKEPTRTLPHICGVSAHMLTGEVLKLLAGLDKQLLRNAELASCLLSHRVWKTELARNPNCRCPHEAWCFQDAPSPDQLTLAELTRRTGKDLQGVAVRGERPWIQLAACDRCDAEKSVQMFARVSEVIGPCKCGGAYAASPMDMSAVIPVSDLLTCARKTMAELGLHAGDCVGIRNGAGWNYFQLGSPKEDAR
jgi:molybdopterin/thiamine biosynthesis adenylyltransferase